MNRGLLIGILLVAAVALLILSRVFFSGSNEVVLEMTPEQQQIIMQMPSGPQQVPQIMPPTQQ